MASRPSPVLRPAAEGLMLASPACAGGRKRGIPPGTWGDRPRSVKAAAIASYICNEPSPIMALIPTQAGCRDLVMSDLEPVFAATFGIARRIECRDRQRRSQHLS